MTRIGLSALAVAVALLAIGSNADTAPVFPGDGTIGIEPPPGMVAGEDSFVGGGASIVVKNMAKDA